ncbi:MAG: pentapeptide repeat-containing protein [Flavobacteriales bacterium]|nr:pentapeptide repeat-containing protein [Flavobacteriales bacterium]
MAIVFFLTGIVTLNIYRLHNELVKIHKKDEQRLIEISEATRNSNRMLIVDKVVEKMAREIDASELNTVSDATINRIAAISNLLRPYELLTNDNNGSVKLSPERGQLLLSILLLNPDSNTFKRIKKSVNFQWSDLRGIQLHDADLSGMNLCHSDLSNSSFTNSSFTNSNLSFSKLEQVEISNCDLSHCTIRQSNLQNAILSNSTIFQTNFSGSNMRFIQMNDSKVLESYFQWADLTGCFAVKADLSGSDFARSEMSGADLRFSNLENGRLAKTVLNGADLSGVNLENVNVQENWFYKMKKVQLIGIDSIMRSYRVDTTESKGGSKYFYLRKL